MHELVQQLAQGTHPLVIGGPQPTLSEFKQRVEEMGYVFIKFTETRGGTDLGVRLDKEACNLNQADFSQGTGTVHLEGSLILNYVRVRCIADIDLATLSGAGHLNILEEVRL